LKISVAWLAIGAGLMLGCRARPQTVAAPPLPTATLTPTVAPSVTLLPAPTSTATSEPCSETQGRLVFEMFASQITGLDFHYRVHLPPCYDATQRRYPLLIMLHGYVADSEAMNDDQWQRLGLLDAADKGYAEGKLAPMVIVLPNGLDASYGQDDSPFGRVITGELLPDAGGKFCLWDDPSRRAIGGLSRGGFWALSIAFLNPGLFGKVGGHSPFVYDGDYPDQNPTNLLETPVNLKGMDIYIDHGAQDFVASGAHELVARLKAHGVQPQYVINPVGKHVEEYWAAHVGDYLAFYTADWPKDASQYPACSPAS
jgi:enterochelin esterase-like enzyme